MMPHIYPRVLRSLTSSTYWVNSSRNPSSIQSHPPVLVMITSRHPQQSKPFLASATSGWVASDGRLTEIERFYLRHTWQGLIRKRGTWGQMRRQDQDAPSVLFHNFMRLVAIYGLLFWAAFKIDYLEFSWIKLVIRGRLTKYLFY